MSTNAPENHQMEAPRRVHILATGGTIAGQGEAETDHRYRPGEIRVDRLIEAVPRLRSLADITGEQVAQIASQNIGGRHWIKLAQRINALFARDEADGVVVTHGTDTAEETAYFLHLVVKSNRPVVMTGAMRPASSLSADGPLNLYNAVAVAANPASLGRGVILVLNDTLHSARDVTKANTTDLQAFISPGPGLLGAVSFGTVRYFRRPVRLHTSESEFSAEHLERLPRIDVIYAHADMTVQLVHASFLGGAAGIVVAGVGNGNVPDTVLGALVEAAKAGVMVVRSTRVGSGEVIRNAEVDDDACGFIAAGQLNPQKCRVLLQLCVARHMDREAVQEAFSRY